MEALGIETKLLIGQIINFLLLFVVLGVFLYKPILKMLEDRRKTIAESLLNAKKIEENLASSEQKTLEALNKAQKEARAILEEANKLASDNKNKIIAEAQTQSEKIIESAKNEAKQAKDNVVADAKKELSSLVIAALGKIVSHEIDDQTKEKITKKSIENL